MGEVVLVTNANTAAAGAVVRELVARGYRVAVTGRNLLPLTRLLPGLSARSVFAVAADFDDPVQSARVRARVLARFGSLDAIVDAAQTGASAA